MGCQEVGANQNEEPKIGSEPYELEIPGLNFTVVEFSPKDAPYMHCVVVTRTDVTAAITCFDKKK